MLFHYLYLSELSATKPPSVFGAICRQARANNASVGVHGALLFDGHRFAQWLQGPQAAIQELASRIEYDDRHTQVQVLCLAEMASQPIQGWRAGFIAPELLDELLRVQPVPQARVDAFLALLSLADLEA